MIAGAATYPDWVERARSQLDEVCGHNAERLPEWSDYDRLPYIAAVVKESFRCATAYHSLTQDGDQISPPLGRRRC